MRDTPEWEVWSSMRRRCYDQNAISYPRYGGRGIAVCDSWNNSFKSFFDDMGERPSKDHSIERIDNNRGYDPDNCRWATRVEQSRNRRSNRILTFNGESRCVMEWAEYLGVNNQALYRRLYKGWPVDRALSTPFRVLSRAK